MQHDSKEPPRCSIFSYLKKLNLPKSKIEEIGRVSQTYPMKASSYYLSLIKEYNDPIYRQCIPSIEEIIDKEGEEDPLCEEKDSPAPLITHRYPDRVLFLISDTCAVYCRFCTRKRKMGTDRLIINNDKIDKAIDYIKNHEEVRDVILSGGDALCAPLLRLEYVLSNLKKIEHVEIIRIGSRLPCSDPEKITQEMCDMLKKYHPVYINVHFEHPDEITEKSIKACSMLADAGIPLGNQNVLLEGINNNPDIMAELYKKLVKMRVKPYYLFQADFVKGTNHFRTSVNEGIDIIRKLRGFISGLCIPHYVIDAPGGGGKIPLIPDYTKSIDEDKVMLSNYLNKDYVYPQKKSS
jgi:lysine 2,3-aminomutase